MIKAFALTAALTMSVTTAQAEPESRWSDSAELVVTAPPTVNIKSICPGMWRLNKGEATLWVMPTLTAVPSSMEWNPACFKRRIKGARLVLIESPPRSIDSRDIELPTGVTLKDVVSPATYERFEKVARKARVSPLYLSRLKPVWASSRVVAATYSHAHLHWEFYPYNLPGIVEKADIPLREVDLFTGSNDLRNIRNELTGADAEACMLSDLDRAEYDVEVVPVIAKAWSRSDMAAVMKNFPTYQNACVPKGMGDPVLETNIKRWKDQLGAVLETPGKVVAAVPIEWFLYKGAVLDQLKAEGVSVSAPKDTE